jgi:Cu/Ag efflux pump CusA
MALGLGEGGEENAPLGRAVIGGLVLATLGTLTFVPAFFSLMHRQDSTPGGQTRPEGVPAPGPTNAEQE